MIDKCDLIVYHVVYCVNTNTTGENMKIIIMAVLIILLTSDFVKAGRNLDHFKNHHNPAEIILNWYYYKEQVETIKNFTKEDIEWLGRNIYFEARGEDLLGKMAVAFVTLNRVIDRRWPSSIKGVITQKKQFSWYNGGYVPPIRNEKLYKECLDIAEMCVQLYNDMAKADGYITDGITNGSDHYFATWIEPPVWAASMKYVGKVGAHLFYKS
jgi:spore germination cell wall hydrolase CwlJ-like protein